ncbi:MAG TPA: HD domain-containing phosphohydrolase [Roseiflexaceae bacterium]|nr:HD domain-containing phosphohydrolase [Roseiflexaceae bacterium]
MEVSAPSTTPSDPGTAKRILIVDDDQMVRDFCARLLRLGGYNVSTAQNGAVALEQLALAPFDLVLTDIHMPVMDGIALLKEIRAHYDDLDVIVFTAYATVETALNALKQGAFDYLTKPVSVSELERSVRRALEWRAIQREKQQLTEIVALYEISQAFTTTLDVDQAVRQIVELLRRHFAPQTLSLSLFHPSDKRLALLANECQTPPAPIGSSTSLSHGSDIAALLNAHDQLSGPVGSPPDSHMVLQVLRSNEHVVGVLRLTRAAEQPAFEFHERRMLAICASQIAASLDNSRLYQQQKEQYLQTIRALAALIDARDTYTRGHSEQVTRYAVRLAQVAGLDSDTVERIRIGGLLHDIGKIGVRDNVLLKPDRLTDAEFALMKTHPAIGADILRPIKALQSVIPMVEWHHERVDGGGYPHGLRGDELSVEVRILSIADAFDAMTSDRAYRGARTIEQALAELQRGRGTQWDAELVGVFVTLIEQEHESLYRPAQITQQFDENEFSVLHDMLKRL